MSGSYLEVCRLLVVEDVALPVVGGSVAQGLIPEGGAALNRQSLVCVDEGLADGKGHPGWTLEVNGDECAWHWRVAGKEERTAFFQTSGKSVTDGIDSQIGAVVSHAHNDGRRAAFSCIEKKGEKETNKIYLAKLIF